MSYTVGIERGGTVRNLFLVVHWQGHSPNDKPVSSGVSLQEANPWGIRLYFLSAGCMEEKNLGSLHLTPSNATYSSLRGCLPTRVLGRP
jgi:hypothetical protein